MSLLRTVRRAAVAGAVHGKVQRRQQNRWAAADQVAPHAAPVQAPPAPPSAGVDDTIAQLERLATLRDSGVLSDAEFQAQKARILCRFSDPVSCGRELSCSDRECLTRCHMASVSDPCHIRGGPSGIIGSPLRGDPC